MGIKLAECRCDADEKMGSFFCSDIKKNIQHLCEIDLIETVHDRKVKLIQEEMRKDQEKREKELIQMRKEEERKLKLEQDRLIRIEKEKINPRKQLEKMALDHKISMNLPDVNIQRMKNEDERELIEI